MAIFYYEFKTPLNVTDATRMDLDTILFLRPNEEIQAGVEKDITPSGYRDQYVLKTKENRGGGVADITADLEVTRRGGSKISAFQTGGEREGRGLKETEARVKMFSINSESPIYVIARPLAFEGKEGFRIDGIVRYEKS